MHRKYYPAISNVLVVGGGRWARVLTEVLIDLISPTTVLSIYSAGASDVVASWVANSGLAGRVIVKDSLPDSLDRNSVVIVANAARDHVAFARWALSKKASVLVEKPIADTTSRLQSLIACSVEGKSFLAPAHVFRFTRYLPNFANHLKEIGSIIRIRLVWKDSASEYRYGQRKTYDSGTPVTLDVLPHVVSILQTLFSLLPRPAGLPVVAGGGAKVGLTLLLGNRSCEVTIERNASQRCRRVVVEGTNGEAVLDFTNEPGTITVESKEFNADTSWPTSPRPLASMLVSFLEAASGGTRHPSLGFDTAKATCNILDTIRDSYKDQQLKFILDGINSGNLLDGSMVYAVSELLQTHARLDDAALKKRQARLTYLLAEGSLDEIEHILKSESRSLRASP